MNANLKFKDRAFISEFENPITDKDHIYYMISSKIFSNHGLSDSILSVVPYESLSSYDSFVVKCKDKDYILKISLDEKDSYLINESLFYLNNEDETLSKYIDSGIIKIGDPIRFILIEDESGHDLNELGASLPILNIKNFFFTFLKQNNFIATRTISDYIKELSDRVDINKLTESSLLNIKDYQDAENLKSFFKELSSSVSELKNTNYLSHYDFCHGNLSSENITSMNDLFKFSNFGDCFYGNRFIDLALMCFNLGLQERDFNAFCREYCSILKYDYESKKEEFRKCLTVSYYIHILRLSHDFIIEQCIYRNSREDKIMSLVKRFRNSLWGLKKIKIENDLKSFLIEMFDKPVDFDEDLREKYSGKYEEHN